MGKVFEPKDFLRRKRILSEALKDLSPGVRDLAAEIIESWKGEESERELIELLGEGRAKDLIRRVRRLRKL